MAQHEIAVAVHTHEAKASRRRHKQELSVPDPEVGAAEAAIAEAMEGGEVPTDDVENADDGGVRVFDDDGDPN